MASEENAGGVAREPKGPKPFSRILAQVADGEAHEQLSEDLHRVTSAVRDMALARRKVVSGELVLKIRLSADERGMVDLTYEITRKEPKPPRPKSTFWIDKSGNLTERNPKQMELQIREVGSGARAPREIVDEATGEVREA